MSDSPASGSVPQVARVTLRIEYAGGEVRELAAEKPHSLDCTITHPLPREPALRGPGVPYLLGDDAAASVQIGFKAGPGHPVVMRAEPARSPQAKLAEIRAYALEPATHEVARDALLAILDRPPASP